jgi:hypothetical protein
MLAMRFTAPLRTLFVAILLAGCGSGATNAPDASETSFIRGSAPGKAYLEARDLQDEFLFHVTILSAPSFHKDALSYASGVELVRLDVDPATQGAPKLRVLKNGQVEPLMTFDVSYDAQGRIEVDFASPGNEFDMGGASQIAAPIEVEGSRDIGWITAGRAAVRAISQDAHTIVADVAHEATTVRRGQRGLVAGDRQGVVTLRLFLRRASQAPQLPGARRTVGEGLARNIGFFASDWRGLATQADDDAAALEAAERASPITRIALPETGTVTIYLKDFPAPYYDVAASAVTSWNIALGRNVLRAAPAPADVDHGDPRYHVIKWVDGLDDTVSWAGIAKAIVDPRSGAVINTNILINGNFNIELYRELHTLTTAMSPGISALRTRVGNLPLLHEQGEAPAIPFFTDLDAASFEDYMKGYYRETITHELGHSLGLRHNFAASTELDADTNLPASVMDYAPRHLRNRGVGPGSYDIAALQWGYFGVDPTRTLPFCTDQDAPTSVTCNQGDNGDPFSYTTTALVDSVALLSSRPTTTSEGFVTTVGMLIKNALKFKRLQSQLPAARRANILGDIEAALDYVRDAEPASGLSATDAAQVSTNIRRVRAALSEAEAEAARQ